VPIGTGRAARLAGLRDHHHVPRAACAPVRESCSKREAVA